MAASYSSRILRRVLTQRPQLINSSRCSSSSLAELIEKDPGRLVSGLTVEDLADPKIRAFLEANIVDDGRKKAGFQLTDAELASLDTSSEQWVEEDEFNTKDYDTPKVDAGLGTLEQQALNIRTLHTFVREDEGTNRCRRLRYFNRIPGILYGSDANLGITSGRDSKVMLQTPWEEFQRELDRFHRKFECRVYDLTVYADEEDNEGTVHRVVPRNVQRHPVQGKIYCGNFLRYFPGRPLMIPITYINQEESPALKRDGYIVPVNKFVECVIEDGAAIPPHLELECTGVQIKEVLKMDRIYFPEGVRPSRRVNVEKFVVGPVFGGRSGAMDDEAPAAAGGGKDEED